MKRTGDLYPFHTIRIKNRIPLPQRPPSPPAAAALASQPATATLAALASSKPSPTCWTPRPSLPSRLPRPLLPAAGHGTGGGRVFVFLIGLVDVYAGLGEAQQKNNLTPLTCKCDGNNTGDEKL